MIVRTARVPSAFVVVVTLWARAYVVVAPFWADISYLVNLRHCPLLSFSLAAVLMAPVDNASNGQRADCTRLLLFRFRYILSITTMLAILKISFNSSLYMWYIDLLVRGYCTADGVLL